VEHFSLGQDRAERAERIAAQELDVLVVGGGIVGAGIARDAAMRGLRVALVEQHDLAFGTSSRSSRLLHGGLRYLAQGRIGLVRQSSREKLVIKRIAPHLAEPLAFVFPTYRRTCWPLWRLRIGVKLYDLLCGEQNLGRSSSMKPAELREHLPGINTKDLTGGVRYFDGLTNDSRLVLDTLRSAARHGAIVCNYTRLEDAARRQAGWRCELRDVLADRAYEVAARAVVNATGPWAASLRHSSVRLRLTKGVHLVVDRQRLPVPDAVVMSEGRRILFAIPWGRRVILGTTDTDYDGPIEAVASEPADVDYILAVSNAAFPAAGLTQGDVLSRWAGLRPLIARRGGGPSDISRAHQIRMPQPGWLDVAGGKLTPYRLIAEEAVGRLLEHLGRRCPPCRTAVEPLLQTQDASGILPPPVGAELVEDYCRNQWAVHLDDVMLRRAGWHYYLRDADTVAGQVAGWMAEVFGWDAPQTDAELARYQQIG
jgi:glycerol-3-phosphate dehydrogenase